MFEVLKTNLELIHAYLQMSNKERAYLLWKMKKDTYGPMLNDDAYGYEYRKKLAESLNRSYRYYRTFDFYT